MGGLTKLEELRRQKMERNRKALLAMVDEQPQASSVQRQIKESAAAPPTARPKKRKLRRAAKASAASDATAQHRSRPRRTAASTARAKVNELAALEDHTDDELRDEDFDDSETDPSTSSEQWESREDEDELESVPSPSKAKTRKGKEKEVSIADRRRAVKLESESRPKPEPKKVRPLRRSSPISPQRSLTHTLSLSLSPKSKRKPEPKTRKLAFGPNVSEENVVWLFDVLKGNESGWVTAKTLKSMLDQMNFDYDEEEIECMIEAALDAEGAKGSTKAVNFKTFSQLIRTL